MKDAMDQGRIVFAAVPMRLDHDKSGEQNN